MAGITSAFCTSFKVELMSAGHCILAPVSGTATGTSGQFSLTALANTTGIAVGMAATGTNVASGAVVASIDSGTQVTLSKSHTGTITAGTITFTGDVIKMALFKASASVTGTYDATTTNYSAMTGDETSGTGYTATGVALTNVSPVSSGTTAYVNFSPNPSWTSATFSTGGCMIYNSSARNGASGSAGAGRAMAIFNTSDQSISAGSYTIIMPSAAAGTAVLRLA